MSRSLRLIPISVLAALALAACGSTHSATVPSLGGGHGQANASSGTLAPWRAAVVCVRRHGMPGVPDPVVGPDGQVSVPGYTTTAQLTPAARSACAAEIRALSGSSTHAIESASEIQALLRVAACMRTHGFPRWPDPNQRGEFHVRSAEAGTPVTESRAVAACNSLFPPNGWHLIVTPTGQ
jgi:hypothetical protein